MKTHPQTGVGCKATCPKCGKRYAWTGKPQGRRCTCGERLTRVSVSGLARQLGTLLYP